MKIADDSMKLTKAFPAAGATAVTDSVDLGGAEVGPVGANLEVHLVVPALANLVEDKTVTISFEDSADDSSWDALPEMGELIVTGGSGDGADAVTQRHLLPPDCRRYLRATATVLADGGDNTGSSLTVEFRV